MHIWWISNILTQYTCTYNIIDYGYLINVNIHNIIDYLYLMNNSFDKNW